MARLEYVIDGDITGLQNAINQGLSLINQLDARSGTLKFNSEGLSALPAALANISSGIDRVKSSADSANVSLAFKKGIDALDTLGQKLSVIRGNSELFGASLKSQEQELAAYQAALNKLLSAGFAPLDGDVTALKIKIDELTASIAAQNAVALQPPKRTTFSEVTSFTEPVTDNGAVTTGLTGAQVLVQQLNADFKQGKLSLVEYTAAMAAVGQETTSTTVKLEREIGILEGLNLELRKLKTAKFSITDPADLARQNKLIQELEAEITRLGNVGKVGFDGTGNSIKNFGKNVDGTRSPIENLGKGLTRGLGYLRQIAFILPGIGIAGIFNLAFEAIEKAAEGLNFFNGKVTQAKSNLDALNAVQKSASQQIGQQIGPLQALYDATQNVNLSLERRLEAAQRLRDEYPTEFANTNNLAIVNGQLKEAYDRVAESIIRVATAQGAQKQIEAEAAKAALATIQIQKIRSAQIAELSRVSGAESASAGVGGGATTSVELQRANINKRAADAIKDQQLIISNARGSIKFLENFVSDFDSTTEKLANANKLLGNNLENFNSLIKRSTDKQQFENIKNALQTKLDSLAPGDAQVAGLRAKIKQVEEIIKNAYTVKVTTGGVNIFGNLQDQLDKLIAKSNSLAASSGLTGYAAQVQKIASGFADINTSLDQLQGKTNRELVAGKITSAQASKITTGIKTTQGQITVNEQRALDAARIAEAQRVSSELQSIDDAFGVKQEQSRKAELAAVQKLANDKLAAISKGIFTEQQIQDQFNASVAAANGNKNQVATAERVRDAEIQSARDAATEKERIQEGLLTVQDTINQKYLQKERELQDSIVNLQNIALDDLSDKETNATNKIVAGWDKRKIEAAKYFDQLRAIYPELSAIITKQQQSTNALFDTAKFRDVSVELSKNFATAMQAGINTLVQDFFTSITTLGQTRQSIDDKYREQYASATDDLTRQQIENQRRIEQSATTSFGAIFSSLISNVFSSFNKSIVEGFTKKLTENIGTTLIKPNADQLGLKTTGVQFSNTVVTSAQSFAGIIDAAATALSLRLNPVSAISNTPNGLTNNELLASGAGGQVQGTSAAGTDFTEAVTGSGDTFSTTTVSAADKAADKTVGAANQSAQITQTAGSQLSSKIATAAAALSVAGGVISGITSPTSSVGQGAGGLLSGAGTGALIGSAFGPVGTIVGAIGGGVIGAISGLFSASKARKQEELQAKQLEQQKETNALLARQNALAYTSSIIGRMTSQGVITGTDINAFGELTAVVSGKNLKFILDRNNGR